MRVALVVVSCRRGGLGTRQAGLCVSVGFGPGSRTWVKVVLVIGCVPEQGIHLGHGPPLVFGLELAFPGEGFEHPDVPGPPPWLGGFLLLLLLLLLLGR